MSVPRPAQPTRLERLACPRCGSARGAELDACRTCAHAPRLVDGVCGALAGATDCELARLLDWRVDTSVAIAPEPLVDGDALELLRACARGVEFKSALEALLSALPEPRSNKLDLVLRECRGAWLPLLEPTHGRALYLGNPLSGTVVGLARTGFRVTVVDLSSERLALAHARDEWLVPGRCAPLLAGDAPRLPFEDGAFDVVVQELGPPRALAGRGYAESELARVAAHEVALIADNRCGYKRSAGEKSSFRVFGPLEYARRLLRPASGARTLRGHRRALTDAGLEPPRALALYPHQSDFAYVASFDARGPHLFIGPKERRNRAKMLVHRLGGFPWLAPSYLLLARKRGAPSMRERILPLLEELARIVDEPVPEIEQLVATRGNTALVQTALAGSDESDPRGRWTLHVTVSPLQEVQARTHYARYLWLREHARDFPIPEPLHCGTFQAHGPAAESGLFVTCERRLSGLTAPQHTGDHAIAAVMYEETARHLAKLVVAPPRALDEALWDELFERKFELVTRYAAVPSTLEWLARAKETARERLLGETIPRVVYHADLRSKHVQVDARGHVLGYLDWGSSEASDLPYFDLLHLIAHERKQESGLSTGAAWAIVSDARRLRAFERAALEDYRERLGLSERYCRAIESLYPLLVTAMAEKNWEYSRPRWMHRSFGI